jgi:RNA polymerase sigma-54 factor
MDLITEIIAKENPAHPLNDQEIAVLLEEKHKLKVARRTVTKYRENLRIGSTRDRKRNFG